MKAGSFDIMDAESANKKARRASLIKTVVIVILAIAVVILGIKATIDANNSGASDENEANEDHGHHRPLVPDANVRDRNKRQVCYTSECIKKSASLFESMNMKADPCEDFHEYACGNFVSNARIPDDKGRWTNFGVISEKIYERGRTILEQGINDGDWETFKMAKRHYKACMDEEKREELGVKPMKEYLEVFGGWPVLLGEAWTKTAEWYETIFKFNEAGFGKDYLVSVSVSADDKNSSWRKIYLDKPSLGMSREYLIKGFEDKDVRSYFTYMKEAAVLYGADEAKADEEMKPVLDLEIKLAKATLSREKRRNSTLLYNPYILGEYKVLEGHPPSWADYIDKILFGQFGISNEETVIIQDVNYLKEMSKIVQETSPRTLANYLAWRAVSSTMTSLNKAAKDISLKYNKARTGKATSSPKWKTCVHSAGFNSYTDSSLRIPASSMYIREHFTPEAKSSMIDMIKYVRSGFEKVLKDIDWMDDVTKGRAEEKLRKMKQMIAYPEEMLDQTLVDDFHKDLVIKEDDYAGNILRMNQWNRKYKFSLLREEVDKDYWVEHSYVALVNAFYNSNINGMEFPAGILQGVFFNHLVPRYLNFGAIGAVIGHEITHGFDDQGRQYNQEGNLDDWWEPATGKKFVEKTKCIIDQYGGYNAKQVDMNLNGVATQGENIADNGGIKEAYMGYDKWVRDNEEEAQLPGIDLTPKQLFWVSWGQVWCTKFRDQSLRKQIKTAAHSPGAFRIIGPLANNEDFARDFNCPSGSKMNPLKKCTVW